MWFSSQDAHCTALLLHIQKYGIFCHLSGYSEEVSMSANSFDLIEIFKLLYRITFANMERVALSKIYQNL